MTEPGNTCSHGIPWTEDCPQCNLTWAQEVVRHFGPSVDEARELIEKMKQTDKEAI